MNSKASQKKVLYIRLFFLVVFLVSVVVGFVALRYFSPIEVRQSKTVVEDSQRILGACKNNNDLERCYGEQFSDLGKKVELDHTLSVFHTLQSVDPRAKSCHFIAHKISQSVVAKNPQMWLGLFEKLDLSECSRGFFHGAIEGYLQYDPEFELTAKSITEICSKVSDSARKKVSEAHVNGLCVHAVGHMLLVQTEGMIDNGIEVCSHLPKAHTSYCYDGVFMENTNRENLTLHGLSEDLEWNEENTMQIRELCKKYSGRIASSCWESIADMYGNIAYGDSARLYQLCQGAPEPDDREKCYAKGSGFMAFLTASRGNTSDGLIASLCKEAPANIALTQSCIQQVVSYVLNSSVSYSEKLVPFCNQFSAGVKKFCYKESFRILGTHSPEALSDFCKTIPEDQQIQCKMKTSYKN